YESLTKIFL
ncbi:hypothetical protein E5Q_05827, partial [Mixia osmundae IAM 14324]